MLTYDRIARLSFVHIQRDLVDEKREQQKLPIDISEAAKKGKGRREKSLPLYRRRNDNVTDADDGYGDNL